MIAIIAAMEEEVQAIVKKMDSFTQVKHSHIDFYVGMLADVSVVITKSGVAKVSAAVSTTVLMQHYKVELVINIGTAGGLMDDQEVLDVVVSTCVAHHDADLVAFGYPKGFAQERFCYQASPKLVEQVTKIIEANDRVWVGPIASGDSFISTEAQVAEIKKDFPEALCVEMEAAAIGQVCRHFDIPFVVIRSLSDITLHKDNHLSFDEYVNVASERSALWCQKIVSQYKKENLNVE